MNQRVLKVENLTKIIRGNDVSLNYGHSKWGVYKV